MYVELDVWRVGAKGAGVYCLVKVLLFLKVKGNMQSF
jgi:hypothetical protein